MTLYEKIKTLYPNLDDSSFVIDILLLDITDSTTTIPDDAVSVGSCYIKKWNHPTLAQPTQAQLDAIGE
jgi:hypothetical protein